MLQEILNLFYPPRCPVCERLTDHSQICFDCCESINFLKGHFTAPHLERVWFGCVRSCFAYEGKLLDAIHRFKYSRGFDVLPMFTFYLVRLVGEMNCDYDLVMPVPMHWIGLWKRGYNQSAILARSVAKNLQIQVDALSLKKRKYIEPQVGLDRDARLKNVKGVFDVHSKKAKNLRNKKILLIDDVLTTGATVNECAKTLIKKANARSIDVLTVARTI